MLLTAVAPLLLGLATAVHAYSPAILWPADQFLLREDQSAMKLMSADDFEKMFQDKKVIVFHKRTLSMEDVSYPSRPLYYLQSVEAIAIRGVSSTGRLLASLTTSESLKIVTLDDGDLADQDQLIRDTMQANPGFAAILIGSGSGGRRLYRRDVKDDEPGQTSACEAREDTPCMVYVTAVKSSNGHSGTCKIQCTESNITISVDVDGLTFDLKADLLMGGYTVMVSGNYSLEVDNNWAPESFSYSCADLRVRPLDPKQSKNVISLIGLQLIPKSGETFPESFDCATWFTTELWMGVLVVVFYVMILFGAILFLLDVKSNDRFDDPKGKTITVNVSD